MQNIKQVMVCGTPMISEIFDKTFEKIQMVQFNGLTWDKLHVL
jgi:hypothetical protein